MENEPFYWHADLPEDPVERREKIREKITAKWERADVLEIMTKLMRGMFSDVGYRAITTATRVDAELASEIFNLFSRTFRERFSSPPVFNSRNVFVVASGQFPVVEEWLKEFEVNYFEIPVKPRR